MSRISHCNIEKMDILSEYVIFRQSFNGLPAAHKKIRNIKQPPTTYCSEQECIHRSHAS